jgi:hypothetical protein
LREKAEDVTAQGDGDGDGDGDALFDGICALGRIGVGQGKFEKMRMGRRGGLFFSPHVE